MMMTLTPWEIRDSTLAFSVAESPWLKRIWTSYPAAVKASLKRASSWSHLGSSLVGRTTPTDSVAAGGLVASGAVVTCGASVGVVLAHADKTIAVTNKRVNRTFHE